MANVAQRLPLATPQAIKAAETAKGVVEYSVFVLETTFLADM